MESTPARPVWRRLLAEFLGTGLLVTVVVGSGIMASRISPHDAGLQLLENSLATAVGLGVLILVLGPVSGAHFNPVVSIVDAVASRGAELHAIETVGYVVVQVVGAIGGALLANVMFGVLALARTGGPVPPTAADCRRHRRADCRPLD